MTRKETEYITHTDILGLIALATACVLFGVYQMLEDTTFIVLSVGFLLLWVGCFVDTIHDMMMRKKK